MITLLVFQITAHLLADFYLQTESKATDKNARGFTCSWLYAHGGIVLMAAWILSFQMEFIFAALFIAMTHIIIDGIKANLYHFKTYRPYLFFGDQLLHLSIIFIAVYTHYRFFGASNISEYSFLAEGILLFAAFLFCSKPANIIIRQILESYNIILSDDENEAELPGAGRLIGTAERWLILIFIFSHQFIAIGFLIAAKSILRYNEPKSEYVLAGTLLSFGIAILAGLIALNVLNW